MDSLFFLTFLVDYNRDNFHLNAARYQIDKVISLCASPQLLLRTTCRPQSTCLQGGRALHFPQKQPHQPPQPQPGG